MKAIPDFEILEKRILKPAYAKGVKERPVLSSKEEFLEFLRSQADRLDDQELEEDLRGIVDERERTGIGIQILSTLRKLRF